MKQNIGKLVMAVYHFVLSRKKALIELCTVVFLMVVAVVVGCNAIIQTNSKYILDNNSARRVRVGIVLGAGVNSRGEPYRELQARLDVAAKALQRGQVDKLILSGDNRFVDYNEPEAMKNYLLSAWHIDADKLQPDYAGRSTYESCERAATVFGLKETIIYSAGSHLPRAIYLCRHFGVTAYGVSSTVEADNSTRRELLARVKAVYNLYFIGERTILGPKINF